MLGKSEISPLLIHRRLSDYEKDGFEFEDNVDGYCAWLPVEQGGNENTPYYPSIPELLAYLDGFTEGKE